MNNEKGVRVKKNNTKKEGRISNLIEDVVESRRGASRVISLNYLFYATVNR